MEVIVISHGEHFGGGGQDPLQTALQDLTAPIPEDADAETLEARRVQLVESANRLASRRRLSEAYQREMHRAVGGTRAPGHHPELPAPRLRLPRPAPASRRLLRRAPARPWARTGVLRRVPACSASPGCPAPRRRIWVRPASTGHSCARAPRLASAPPELLASTSPLPLPGRSASASHRLQPPVRPHHELSLPSQAPLGPPSSFARTGLPPSAQPGPAGSAPPGFSSPRADSPPCPPAGSRGPASPCLGRLAPLAGVRLVAPPRGRVPHARAGSPRSSPAGSRH
nr:formin-like protein 5 [Aegilops tauschii subsp. strangulata]